MMIGAYVNADEFNWEIIMGFISTVLLMSTTAFGNPIEEARWRVINDTVMGGVSSSEITPLREGGLVFRGELSLDNNGGFASTRANIEADWSRYDALRAQFRGDGREYLVTVRIQEPRFGRIYYRTPVQTSANRITNVSISFADFEAYAFGTRVVQAPRLISVLGQVRSVGIMLADKREGPFSLTILDLSPETVDTAKAMHKSTKQAIMGAIEQAIGLGVPLYNQGNPERCYDVYRTAVSNILTLSSSQLNAGQKRLLQNALEDARRLRDPSDQAWAMRTAMDAMVSSMQ